MREGPPPRIVVAAESVSLSILSSLLEVQRVGPSYTRRIDIDGEAEDSETQHQVLAFNMCASIVGTAQALQNYEMRRVLYVRPRLLKYADGIAALTQSSCRDELFHKLLLVCDHLLQAATIIELEALCFDSGHAIERFARWLGIEHIDTNAGFEGRRTYGRAMHDLAHALRTSSSRPTDLLPLSQTLAFGKGTIATAILQHGWCGPEGNFVWSIGSSSTLKIPVAGGSASRLCTIGGYLFHEDIRLDLRHGGTSSPCVLFRKGGLLLDIIIDLGCQDGIFEIEIGYDQAMSPHDRDPGNSDRRALAFAMHTVRIDEASETHRGLGRWSASEIATYDPEETALIYAAGSRDGSLEALVARNARILAQDNAKPSDIQDGAKVMSRFDRTCQGDVRQFMTDLSLCRTSMHVTVGTERVDEVLDATADMESVATWATFTFRLEDHEVAPRLLRWVLQHKYTLVLNAGCAHAYPERIGAW